MLGALSTGLISEVNGRFTQGWISILQMYEYYTYVYLRPSWRSATASDYNENVSGFDTYR